MVGLSRSERNFSEKVGEDFGRRDSVQGPNPTRALLFPRRQVQNSGANGDAMRLARTCANNECLLPGCLFHGNCGNALLLVTKIGKKNFS